ncbi:MAG: plastocyanin/azurin family copper-binding protein [Bacillota bacterium]|nr:plastocyanin/azurin family copper-binding protein [Bacillota bacterium]
MAHAAWRRGGRSLLAAVLVLVAVALVASACGGGGSAGAGGGTTAQVSLKEYSITIDGTTLSKGGSMQMKPGKVTFNVTNDGTMVHDFAITGPGVDESQPKGLQPKQSTTVSVTLQKGSYQVWCTQPGHKDLGMYGVIQVQ